jgi:hypothetical protein
VKAPGATGDDLVDPHFERARPQGLESQVVAADDKALGRLLNP